MALRGSFSQSFLRSKELLSFSEISHDKEGNNILKSKILEGALARDSNGKFIRNKVNIAKILNKYGVLYRMVFNAMNMDQYTYEEVQEALKHLSEYINDLGVSGIVEFHAADKTQNSDHIHFWISSEDTIIYNKIAQEMVAMGYSNEEDVYIQKYEDNEKLDELDYVYDEDTTLKDRFSIKPMGMEAGDTLNSINEMLSIDNDKQKFENSKYCIVIEEGLKEVNPTSRIGSSFYQKYTLIVDNISNLLKKNIRVKDTETDIIDRMEDSVSNEHLESFNKKISVTENCTLVKTEETTSILSRIEELRREIS